MKKRLTTPTQRSRRTTMDTKPRGKTRDVKKEIISWLRDAYAMERSLEKGLKKNADNKKFSSELRRRSAIHLKETRRHAEAVKSALHSLDADTSSIKTSIGVIGETGKALSTKLASDEQIKDLLDAYGLEHIEIASYTALAAAAERAGFTEVVEACQSIIPDEERMAQALIECIPEEIARYLFAADTVHD